MEIGEAINMIENIENKVENNTGENKIVSMKTKEMLHGSMREPLLVLTKARRNACNLLGAIEEVEAELRKMDLLIDRDDREAIDLIWLNRAVENIDNLVDRIEHTTREEIRIRFEAYNIKIRDAYEIKDSRRFI